MIDYSAAKAPQGKTDRSKYLPVNETEIHKGFYCDDNCAGLEEIDYNGHLSHIDDDEEHLTSGGCLLRGSCQAFALKIEEILGYKAFIVEERDGNGHHVFCSANLNGKTAYIDARGVTTSFDEFFEVASEFVKKPYRIRRVNKADITGWSEASCDNSHEEHLALAEAVIRANIECYRID